VANTVIANSSPNMVTPATPMAIASTAVPNTAFLVSFQWDISQNPLGNTTGSTLQIDVSYDSGNNWLTNYLVIGRPQGDNGIVNKIPSNNTPILINDGGIFITPGSNNMVRCRLIATGNINTFIQIVAMS
jgi:hypothetical protein